MEFPRKFFDQVLHNTLETNRLDVEIRCLYQLPGGDSFRPKQFWCRTVQEIEEKWSEICELNKHGYNINFTVVPRLREFQGKKEHPLPEEPIFNCFWADLDVGEGKPFKRLADALICIENAYPRPTIVVESGSGLHAYYVLARPRTFSLEKVKDLLSGLASRLRADTAAARATRLMRVPNTLNWKDGKAKICRVWYSRDTTCSRSELQDLAMSTVLTEDSTAPPPTKYKSDYFDLFSPHVNKLVRKGEWARGLCPFHDDQNPSFSVNAISGHWVCFACGIDGKWPDFKRRLGIADSDLGSVERRAAIDEYEWSKLPRFDPTKAPKTKWLVEGLVPERGITMFVGAPGAFKSTFALLLADAVSKGEEFLDRNTRKRRVLYLDNENPPDVLKVRNESMKLEMEANQKLRLWSIYDKRPVPRILDQRLRIIVKKSVQENRKPLIVLDHWSSFLRAGEGGETTGQISQLLQELKHLCALGATVVLLHHSRKYDVEIEYGGGDLRAKCDAIHTLVTEQDKIDPNKKIIRVQCFLKRHGGNSSFAIKPEVINGQVVGFEYTRDPQAAELSRKREVLRSLIKHNVDITQHELIEKAQEEGLSRDDAREILKRGVGKYWKIKVTAHGAKRYKLLDD